MSILRRALVLLLVAGLAGTTTLAQSSAWIDRVSERWNAPGGAIPAPPAALSRGEQE